MVAAKMLRLRAEISVALIDPKIRSLSNCRCATRCVSAPRFGTRCISPNKNREHQEQVNKDGRICDCIISGTEVSKEFAPRDDEVVPKDPRGRDVSDERTQLDVDLFVNSVLVHAVHEAEEAKEAKTSDPANNDANVG